MFENVPFYDLFWAGDLIFLFSESISLVYEECEFYF